MYFEPLSLDAELLIGKARVNCSVGVNTLKLARIGTNGGSIFCVLALIYRYNAEIGAFPKLLKN